MNAMTRWKYGDMAGLYDMEFEYIQDQFTYDEYLLQPKIKDAIIDTFYDFKVTSVQFFDRDSANIHDIVTFIGRQGDTIRLSHMDMVYYHRDRWIRPTLGYSQHQHLYEEMIRKADSAAAVEEREEDGK
jgi:hypothetical protein